MHGVLVDGRGEVGADGAGRGVFRVGRAHDLAVLRDGILAFQHLRHDRTRDHEGDQIVKERTLLVHGVKGTGLVPGQMHHLGGNDPQTAALEARGDAVMTCVADLQDPPELLREFVAKWEQGYKVVIGIKQGTSDSWLMARTRRFYYGLVTKLSSDTDLIKNFTGFGLYDREVVELFRLTGEQYPYLRGLVSEFGFPMAEIPYVQPGRKHGVTKNNFFTLYDLAMLGITSHSNMPLRLATMVGFGLSILSLTIALVYLVLKLVWWNTFDLGLAPLVIGVYFFGAVQLFFIGVLGEYIGSINTQVHRRPIVVERERINFGEATDEARTPEKNAPSGPSSGR